MTVTTNASISKGILPVVSLVVPMYNETDFIAQCLDSLVEQDYPTGCLELLIVDGMSTDNSAAIVQAYMAKYANVRLLQNPRRLTPVAFNVGIRAAQGDLIGLVSSHCSLATDYVSQCVHHLQETGAWNVGGRQQTKGQDNLVSQLIALATTSPFGIGGSKFHYSNKAQYVDTVYMGVYPRWVFDKVGLFDETLVRNQDYEFNHRVLAAGGKIYFTPKIRSEYHGRTTLSKFWRQYFQYGFWKVQVLKKHPDSVKIRHLVAPAFVLSLVTSMVVGIWWTEVLLFSAGILSTYVCAAMMASLLAARKNRQWIVFLLPFVFLILHVSWGLGFLWGIVTAFFPAEKISS
ncbi:MAG: glycosyltransferase family 2 protein [Chloroflexota bacterium]|nr:glycosyltransferase family 2 protein [Chloroflexota bacterium]